MKETDNKSCRWQGRDIKLPKPDKKKAIFTARKLFTELVFDTVYLEDSPYTFPEVQTLLEGVTVGGHRLSDQQLVLNQAGSWKMLLDMVERGVFTLTKETACRLHHVVSKEEALTWGEFREIPVRISGTEWVPPPHGALDENFEVMVSTVKTIQSPHVRGINLFLEMARNQFFCDGNKLTGRLIMNGIILSHGYEAISVPAKRKLEFNQKMIRFYDSGDSGEMVEFLLRCGRDIEVNWQQEHGDQSSF